MTSAPPLTLTKVQIVSPTTVDLGALLSPRLVAPRIKAGPIVYAYNATEVTNPVHGNGYVNTVQNQSYIYMQNSWIPIGVAGPLPANVMQVLPHVNSGDAQITGDLIANAFYSTGSPSLGGPGGASLGFVGGAAARVFARALTGNLAGGVNISGGNSDLTSYVDYATFRENTPGVYGIIFYANTQTHGNVSVYDGKVISVADAQNAGQLQLSSASTESFIDAYGVNGSNIGQHHFRGYNVDGSQKYDVMTLHPSGSHINSTLTLNAAIVATGAQFGTNASTHMLIFNNTNRFFIDSYSDNNTTAADMILRVGTNNNTSVESLWIQSNGSAQFNHNLNVVGTLTAGVKTFNIPHPQGGGRRLVHACLEGPENGVYYRGEAELVDGRAIVELPAYFEALTQADGRTVQLTQVDDGGDLGLFAASPVVDGKFSIRSNVSAAIVSWEVKAERRDLPRLDAEPATKGERSESES
jgi:hypothetical protein